MLKTIFKICANFTGAGFEIEHKAPCLRTQNICYFPD